MELAELFAEFAEIIQDIEIPSLHVEEDYRYVKMTVRFVDGTGLRVSEFGIPGEDPVKYSYYLDRRRK